MARKLIKWLQEEKNFLMISLGKQKQKNRFIKSAKWNRNDKGGKKEGNKKKKQQL